MPWLAVGALAVVTFALGVLFGAAEVSTVAFSEEEGQQGAAGFLLALWALGSLVAGLISGAISWRQGPLVRLRWGALGMAAAMVPLALVPSIPLMGLVLLIGGFAISPTLIAATSLAEQVLPPARLTEGMMLLQTGIALGLAPGAALGRCRDRGVRRVGGVPGLVRRRCARPGGGTGDPRTEPLGPLGQLGQRRRRAGPSGRRLQPVRSDGAVVCWGRNHVGQATVPGWFG